MIKPENKFTHFTNEKGAGSPATPDVGAEPTASPAPSSDKFDSWAIVELFGHQKIAGRVREATIAGGAFIRVDVPKIDEQPGFTRFFGPGAIYSINPTSEEIATAAAAYHVQPPVQRYELPKLAERNDESPYENDEP